MPFLIGAVLGVAVGLIVGIVGTSSYYEHQILAGYTRAPPITTGGTVAPPGQPANAR